MTFYYHTFSFQQVLIYNLSEHLYLLIFIYSFSIFFYQFILKNQKIKAPFKEKQDDIVNQSLCTLLIEDGNKKQHIQVSEIFYFSANSPYINSHLAHKKYLHNDTLKGHLEKWDGTQFVRVHKTTIVNIGIEWATLHFIQFFAASPSTLLH